MKDAHVETVATAKHSITCILGTVTVMLRPGKLYVDWSNFHDGGNIHVNGTNFVSFLLIILLKKVVSIGLYFGKNQINRAQLLNSRNSVFCCQQHNKYISMKIKQLFSPKIY